MDSMRTQLLALVLVGCGQLDDRGSTDDFRPSQVSGPEPAPAPADRPDASTGPSAVEAHIAAVDALLPLIPPKNRSVAYGGTHPPCPEGEACANGDAGAACWVGFEDCANNGMGADCWDPLEACFFELTCRISEAACEGGDMDACPIVPTCANALGCEIDAERCGVLGDPPELCLSELTGCWSFAGLDTAAVCANAHTMCITDGGEACEETAETCMNTRGEQSP